MNNTTIIIGIIILIILWIFLKDKIETTEGFWPGYYWRGYDWYNYYNRYPYYSYPSLYSLYYPYYSFYTPCMQTVTGDIVCEN
jgi:hypothetical protein